METLYKLAKDTIKDMKVGAKKEIAAPEDLKALRKYIYEISKKEKKRFKTRLSGGNLQIIRVQCVDF